MTEARHDQAVALLTASSPTIVLLVEREAAEQPGEGDAPGVPRGRMHSPPPPSHGDSPPEEPPPPRNPLPKGLEDQYPIEVSLPERGALSLGCCSSGNGRAGGWPAVLLGCREVMGNALVLRVLTLCSPTQNTPTPCCSASGPYVTSLIAFASCSLQEIQLVKAGGPLGLSIVGGSDHSSHPFGIHEPGVFISKVRPACAFPGVHLLGLA